MAAGDASVLCPKEIQGAYVVTLKSTFNGFAPRPHNLQEDVAASQLTVRHGCRALSDWGRTLRLRSPVARRRVIINSFYETLVGR